MNKKKEIITCSFDLSEGKTLRFSSDVAGLLVNGIEYYAGEDGVLIYDKTDGLQADEVTCQLSTNTSSLIPALRILGISYHPYFDRRDVVESQNDITFYWKPSRLAAFYNRFGTDGVDLLEREPKIREAVSFLQDTADAGDDFLPAEILVPLTESCKLLGFYDGFPIFDAAYGLPQLQSRLGIHIGTESVLVSTPMDRYAEDVKALAEKLEQKIGVTGRRKKNRIRFEKSNALLAELGITP